MIKIITQEKSVYINGSRLMNKGAFDVDVDESNGYIQILGFTAVPYSQVELDGQVYSTLEELVTALDKVFYDGGGAPSEGVQSIVQGNNISIDNTDPRNPVISADNTEWGDIQNKPVFIASGETAADARSSIGAASTSLATAGANGLYPNTHFGIVNAIASVSSSGTTTLDGGFNTSFIRSASANSTYNISGIKASIMYRVKITNTNAGASITVSFQGDGSAISFISGSDGIIPASGVGYFEVFRFNSSNMYVRKL